MGGVSWSAAAVEAECRMNVAMWDVAARCTMPSRMSSTPLPRSSRTRVDADMIRLRMTKRITSRLTRNRLHLAACPSSASILITALALAAREQNHRVCDVYDHFDSVILRPGGGSKREGSKGRSVSEAR